MGLRIRASAGVAERSRLVRAARDRSPITALRSLTGKGGGVRADRYISSQILWVDGVFQQWDSPYAKPPAWSEKAQG